MAGFCLGIAMAFMGLALVLHLNRARSVGKSVSKLVYICSCIVSGKHILPFYATLTRMNCAPKISPPKKSHSKSPHIQNVTTVNLCLVN